MGELPLRRPHMVVPVFPACTFVLSLNHYKLIIYKDVIVYWNKMRTFAPSASYSSMASGELDIGAHKYNTQ